MLIGLIFFVLYVNVVIVWIFLVVYILLVFVIFIVINVLGFIFLVFFIVGEYVIIFFIFVIFVGIISIRVVENNGYWFFGIYVRYDFIGILVWFKIIFG